MTDKYSTVWVSHSSISDYLKCPRLYYLNNVYKNPKTNHKISIMQPALALGQAIHETLENLSTLNTEDRFKEPLIDKFGQSWEKITGKNGGFKSASEENEFKTRGTQMIKRVLENPGPIANKAIKIKSALPSYFLAEDENIILCGKIDWLEYLEDTDSVHIIDFKTGKNDEKENSLQLPIYYLLVKNLQKRKITKASYWYLERNNELTEQKLTSEENAFKSVMSIALTIKKARQTQNYNCPKNGCYACEKHEAIIRGEAELIGVNDFNQDVFIF